MTLDNANGWFPGKLLLKEASVAVAGGAESMSRGPYWMPSARWGARMGDADLVDPVMGALTDPFHSILMGVTAENLVTLCIGGGQGIAMLLGRE